MKQIKLNHFDTSIFYEKLPNGLEVYLAPMTNRNSYYATYATKFGSITKEFIPYNSKKPIKVPEGIAHFLEHKMFEQEDGVDPFTYFAKSGTGANASTNYNYTQYLCYGNKEIEKNILFLLDYVSKPYFTAENVEKEKGIIAQEIEMYDDEPEWMLDEELKKCLFKVDPIRDDIAGTVFSINKITSEDLYNCYYTFYQPSNMFLIVSGNFDAFSLLNSIKAYFQEQKQVKVLPIKKIIPEEPKEINCDHRELAVANLKVPKIAVGLKVLKDTFKDFNQIELNYYLNMYLTIGFGYTSPFMEKARPFMTGFNYGKISTTNYWSIEFYAETDKTDQLIDLIKQNLTNLKITKDDVERIKKVWLSLETRLTDSVEGMAESIFDDIIHFGEFNPNHYDIIKKLNYNDLMKVVAKLDLTNLATVKMMPKED